MSILMESENIVSFSYCNLDSFSKQWTIKSILQDYWESYLETHNPREIELNEVEKALTCYEKERGCFVYYCSNCSSEYLVKVGCNSRLCSYCGKKYADAWSKNLSKRMFKVKHRHIVLSIPNILWKWLKNNRDNWKDYMDSGILTLNDVFSQMLNKDIKVGAIIILHPFGKDLDFKPHLHLLITEGGFDSNNNFIHDYFIPAELFRKKWQYHVLKVLQSCGLPNSLASLCYKRYSSGFYVWVDGAGRIKNLKTISNYLGRYVRHPSIANSRIVRYEKGMVTFYYRISQDSDEVKFITKPVDDFIDAILQHIPESQFKMIRYYGAYSRNNVKTYRIALKQSSIEVNNLTKFLEKEPIICPNCNSVMKLVGFRKPKPP